MRNQKVSPLMRMVFTALFAALVFVATYIVRIPIPLTGYVNLGDGMILFAAFLLGPWWSWPAAAIGAALADLVAAYAVYIPGTFADKALTAIVAGLLFRLIMGRGERSTGRTLLAAVVAGVVGELVMAGGYLLYESLVLGYGWAAVAAVPANLVQGAAGVVLATALYLALVPIGAFKRLFVQPESREREE